MITTLASIVLTLALQQPVYIRGPCPAANCLTQAIVPTLLHKEVA